jgi:hypothetical protein
MKKLWCAATTGAVGAQQAKIDVKATDNSGAWYAQPVWLVIGIIALGLILVLISLAVKRERTTIVK